MLLPPHPAAPFLAPAPAAWSHGRQHPRPGQELGSSLLLGENTVYLVTLRKERAGIAGDTPCSLQDACCRERVIYFCRGNRRVSGNVADFSVGGGNKRAAERPLLPGGEPPRAPQSPQRARGNPRPCGRAEAPLGSHLSPLGEPLGPFIFFFLLPFPFPYPTVAAAAAAHLRSAPRDARLGALRRLRRCRGAEWRREGAASEPLVSR